VLTTCQPSTVWCSRERLPAAATQPVKVRQSCSATDYNYIIIVNLLESFLIFYYFTTLSQYVDCIALTVG
jgi:hypothetical protein